MDERFVTANGVPLRVVRRTPGRGQSGLTAPLLMVNGLGGSAEHWQPLIPELPGRDLIMVDHPGTGLSAPLDRFMPMRSLAALYVAVLDQLGVDRADLLGFSFGGAVAQQMAVDHPARLNSLILAGTSCGWGGVPANPMTLFIASNPLRYQFPEMRKASARYLYRGRAGRDPQLFETELKGMRSHPASMRGIYHQVSAYSSWTSVPWLRELSTPTLVLAGSQDPMAPAANSRLLAAKIPGAELRIFKGGGHLFLFDSPGQAGPVIRSFLARQEAVAV